MRSVPHKQDPEDYKRWLSTVSAQRMLALQSAWLQNQIGHLNGHHLMYHGLDTNMECLSSSPIKHKFRMALPWQQDVIDADAWMTSNDWPLPDQSIDMVVMQHSLDFTRRPHQMIREASRVLVPDGNIVIIGFNPWSWWGGVRAIMPFASRMPWVANMVSMRRLKDWLTLLGFTISDSVTLGHLWPITLLPQRFSLRVDSVLAGTPALMGNFYMIVAHKTTLGVTPLRSERWTMIGPQLGWANIMTNNRQIKETK
jgi:SAM-dependent methyltransferase